VLTIHHAPPSHPFIFQPSQIAGGIIGTLSIVVYGHVLRRPPLPVHRVASLAAFASAGGVIGGTVVRANAHADFFRTLDNRPAFFQAIDNIQSRLGEKPSGLRSRSGYPYTGSDNEHQELADNATNSRGWGEQMPRINRTVVDPSTYSILSHRFMNIVLMRAMLGPTQPPPRKSRWEEIRAEHARSMATRSSWDELRQNASRPKSGHTESDQIRRSQDPAVDRLTEQQKFDAILEAERRRAASGP
jgi:hypothetical protein